MPPRVVVIPTEPSDLAVIESAIPSDEAEMHVVAPSTPFADLLALEPDVIVIDVLQPHVDSFAICRAIRGDDQLCEIPIIVLDSRDGLEVRPLAFAAGCDEVLEKPVNRHLLAYRLRSYARLRRRKRASG